MHNVMRKFSAKPGFEPGAPGWEARILPLCYAAPLDSHLDLTGIEFEARGKRRIASIKDCKPLSDKKLVLQSSGWHSSVWIRDGTM